MEKQLIEQKSQEIINKYNSDSSNIDIVKIAKQMGFVVGDVMLPEDYDGFILVNNIIKNSHSQKGVKLIGVNPRLTPEKKNFVIARELSHYILDNGENENIFAHREHKKEKNDKENDVDYFVANVLMPKELFEKRYKALKPLYNGNNDGLVEDLARYFMVECDCVKRRVDEVIR